MRCEQWLKFSYFQFYCVHFQSLSLSVDGAKYLKNLSKQAKIVHLTYMFKMMQVDYCDGWYVLYVTIINVQLWTLFKTESKVQF